MKTLKEHLKEYCTWRSSLNLNPGTVLKNKSEIKVFIHWLKTMYHVDNAGQIYTEHLYQWQKHLANAKTRQGRLFKPRTINLYIVSTKGFLSYLADNGHARKDYPGILRYVKEPKTLGGSVLTHAQVRRMLDAMPSNDLLGYRNRTMLELLYSTGVRSSELLGLNTFDIDLKNSTMCVTGKGDKQRMVPIGKTALKYLETYINAIRVYLLKDLEQDALFLSHTGNRFIYRNLLRVVKLSAQRAGYANVSAHTFRRSCATEMVRAEANMYHVKELLGHESLDTLKHYTRLTINDLKRTHQLCHPREKDDPENS